MAYFGSRPRLLDHRTRRVHRLSDLEVQTALVLAFDQAAVALQPSSGIVTSPREAMIRPPIRPAISAESIKSEAGIARDRSSGASAARSWSCATSAPSSSGTP